MTTINGNKPRNDLYSPGVPELIGQMRSKGQLQFFMDVWQDYGDLAHMVGEAQNIAAELRAAAGQIDNASDRARAEQQHRERERERWRREKREEERREREARERRERERRKNS